MFICSHHVFLQVYVWHQEATGQKVQYLIKMIHVLQNYKNSEYFVCLCMI